MDLTRKMSVDILSAFDTNNERVPIIIDKYRTNVIIVFMTKLFLY